MVRATKKQQLVYDLDEVLSCFNTLDDPRSSINRHHALDAVLVIAVLAVLAGASGPSSIALWAKKKRSFLESILSLPYGPPSKDVFRRVLMAIQPSAFQQCFLARLQELRQLAAASNEAGDTTLAIDGKTLRRSHD